MKTMPNRRGFINLCARTALSTLAATALCGCESVRKRKKIVKVMPNVFDNDPTKLAEAFKKIVWKKTTRQELEVMGFKLGTKNVPIVVGVPAFLELFGKEAFRNMEQNGFLDRLPELNRFSFVQFPFQDTLETSDRIYLNKKTTTFVGWDMMFTIVMHDDLVVYAAPRHVYHDETRVDKAFLRGLIEFFSEIGQVVGIARP